MDYNLVAAATNRIYTIKSKDAPKFVIAKITDKGFLVDLILPFSGFYKSDLGMT